VIDMLRTLQQRFLAGFAAGAALTFSACTTLGPDYTEPQVAWLEAWETDLYGQFGGTAQQKEADLQYWWHLFQDPKLNKLIELARVQNPSLRIAGLRILESRATLGIADSLRYPQAQQTSGGLTYVDSQQTNGQNEQSFSSYDTGFVVGWEMDFWGKFQRGIESADAAFFASIANQRDGQVLLAAQVADAYFAYRTSVLRIQIAESNAEIQKRSFEITQKLFASGQQSELDLQQAKTQYLATVSTIPDLELNLHQVRNALCALLGQPPSELSQLLELPDQLPELAAIRIDAIPAQLLLRRPDVRAAAWQVAAQSPQIGAAEADLYPSVSLFGSIGFAANTRDTSEDTVTLGVGPSFTWNILDYGRIKNNVRVQDARLQIAIESFQNALLAAAREMDDAAYGVIKTREKQVTLSESLVAARRSLELANRNYKEGYADFQRVLDAQRSVASQSEQELINIGKQISAVVDFYRAIGGGWLPSSLDQMLPSATREKMETRSDWGDLIELPLPQAQTPN
jgi:NodT family efflux transporter outer membrane factor (OMF) lipoprotein